MFDRLPRDRGWFLLWQNDRAVMQAYGFDVKTTTETSCVAHLMKLYQQLTS